MCKVTQIPFLFTECHHLSVVAAFEPCTDTHVPGRSSLFCGPAEWNYTTVKALDTHPSRCKNCRSRSGGPATQSINWPAQTKGHQNDDLISLSVPTIQLDDTQQTQSNEPQPVSAAAKKRQTSDKKPVAVKGKKSVIRKVELPEGPATGVVNTPIEKQEEKAWDEEVLKRRAAEMGVPLEDYKFFFFEQRGLNNARSKHNASRFQEQSSPSEENLENTPSKSDE